MITGTVNGAEMFDVTPAVAAVNRDRDISLAPSELEYRQRVSAFLQRAYPGSSDGFTTYVTDLAWDAHTKSTVRMEVSPAAVACLVEAVDSLPGTAGAESARAAIASAAARLGWDEPVATTGPGSEPAGPRSPRNEE